MRKKREDFEREEQERALDILADMHDAGSDGETDSRGFSHNYNHNKRKENLRRLLGQQASQQQQSEQIPDIITPVLKLIFLVGPIGFLVYVLWGAL